MAAASFSPAPWRRSGAALWLVSWLGVALLAGCSRQPPAQEPVRAVKLVTVAESGLGRTHDYAADVRARVKETLSLMSALSAWGDEMLRLEPATLMKVMKLGGKIQKLLRDNKR